MIKSLHVALLVLAIVVLCAGTWGVWGLYHHLIVALDKWGDASPQETLTKLNQSLDTINRPCGNGHPCGTLANADKAMVKVSDILVTSQLQERDVAKAAESNMEAVNGLAEHLNKTADALSDTAKAGTGTLQQARTDLGTLNGSIAALTPLENSLAATAQASTTTINSVNARISDPRVDALLSDFRSIADSGTGIMADGKTVSDYATKQLTAKKTLLQRIEGFSGDLFDITAYLARHYR